MSVREINFGIISLNQCFFSWVFTQDFWNNLGYFSQEFQENLKILGILEQNHSNLQEFDEILGYFQNQIKNTDGNGNFYYEENCMLYTAWW